MSVLLEPRWTPLTGQRDSAGWPELAGKYLPPAWRVGISRTRLAFPMAFGRKRDAELAIAALKRHGITDRESARKAGRKELDRIMVEAMAW